MKLQSCDTEKSDVHLEQDPAIANFLIPEINQYSILGNKMVAVSLFFLYHRKAIEESPLQVYVSALVFSPGKSILKGLIQDPRGKKGPLRYFFPG
jgi:hypothetical protein